MGTRDEEVDRALAHAALSGTLAQFSTNILLIMLPRLLEHGLLTHAELSIASATIDRMMVLNSGLGDLQRDALRSIAERIDEILATSRP